MTTIPRAIERVRGLVPDLEQRIGQFEAEAFEVDDELMDAFFEELERLVGDLQAGLDASDDEKIRASAHSMKGMCGSIGLPEISVLAQEIEITLRDGEMEPCRRLCAALIAWARELLTQNR